MLVVYAPPVACHDTYAVLKTGLRKLAFLQILKVLFGTHLVLWCFRMIYSNPQTDRQVIYHSLTRILLFYFFLGYYIASWLIIRKDLLTHLRISRMPHRETHFFCRCVFFFLLGGPESRKNLYWRQGEALTVMLVAKPINEFVILPSTQQLTKVSVRQLSYRKRGTHLLPTKQ